MATAAVITIPALLKKIKRKALKLEPNEIERYNELVEFYNLDFRAFFDEQAKLSASERKERLAPFLALQKQWVKVLRPNSGYSAPPIREIRFAIKAAEGILGWFKNAHKYKVGELHDPATPEELEALQTYLRGVHNDDYKLPTALVQSLLICNGMTTFIRMHDGIRLLTTQEIPRVHENLTERGFERFLPFGEDGCGNFYALYAGDVYDLNHEDDSAIPTYPSLGRFLKKAHKITR